MANFAPECSAMYLTSEGMESTKAPVAMPPAAWTANSPKNHSGSLSPMMATTSPASKPRPIMPSEKYLTFS